MVFCPSYDNAGVWIWMSLWCQCLGCEFGFAIHWLYDSAGYDILNDRAENGNAQNNINPLWFSSSHIRIHSFATTITIMIGWNPANQVSTFIISQNYSAFCGRHTPRNNKKRICEIFGFLGQPRLTRLYPSFCKHQSWCFTRLCVSHYFQHSHYRGTMKSTCMFVLKWSSQGP